MPAYRRINRLEMDRAAGDGEGGFFESFGERGVGVAGAGDVFARCAELHGGGGFGDQVAGAGAEDVHAEHAVGLGVGEHFDLAGGVAEREGAAVGAEREAAFAVGDVLFFQLVFGAADAGDLGLGEDDGGDHVVVDVAVPGDDLLGDGDAFLFGLVGEHRAGDAIADRVDAVGRGAEVIIDRDAARLSGWMPTASRPRPSVYGTRPTATSTRSHLSGSMPIDFDGGAGLAGARGGHALAEMELDALLLEDLEGFGGELAVGAGEDAVEELDDGDL